MHQISQTISGGQKHHGRSPQCIEGSSLGTIDLDFAVNPLWFCDSHLAPQILSSLLLALFRSFAPMINAMMRKCSLRGLDHTLLNTFAKCSKDYILDSLAGRVHSITRRNSLFYLKLNALNGQAFSAYTGRKEHTPHHFIQRLLHNYYRRFDLPEISREGHRPSLTRVFSE